MLSPKRILLRRFEMKKSFAFLIVALIMVLTSSWLPTAIAAPSKRTYCYLGVTPNPVGVGQKVLLHVGITDALTRAYMGWEGITITIKKPDGSMETLGPFKTDATGGTGVIYVPTIVGTYYLQAHFPQQNTTSDKQGRGIPVGTVMLASDSEVVALIVQETPRPEYPPFSLPSEFWTRPVDAQLREWAWIAGSWLTTPRNLFAPYNQGPESPHILWTEQLPCPGGLVGGELGEPGLGLDALGYHGFVFGDAYEGKWGGSIIIAGRLYYRHNTLDYPLWYYCVDLHTGELLWRKVFLNNQTVTFGNLLYWDTYNLHGTYAYLWVVVGSDYYAFDAWTGDWVFTIKGVPSGTRVLGPKGEILIYTFNLAMGWMTLWNSTNIPALWLGTDPYYRASWRPQRKTVNATAPTTDPACPLGKSGYMWNKTIPAGLPGSVRTILDDRVLGALLNQTHVISWGLSLERGKEGQLLFQKTWRAPSEWFEGNLTVVWKATTSNGKNGVFVIWTMENRQYWGFSAETGEYLWGPTQSEDYRNMWGGAFQVCTAIAYNKLFSVGYAGIVYCYDVKTGKLLWTYNATDPYVYSETWQREIGSSNWPLYIMFITDGKIYLGEVEHSPGDPRARGAPFICLDVETGREIWRVDGLFKQTAWGGRAIIGDSIIVTQDTYDQRVYAIGKGPTRTTVSAPDVGVSVGSTIVIRGTVTDVSPGTRDTAIQLRFPDGVPAVADESMGEWMLYVYKQFPRPANATGVWVKLDAINVYTGEYIDIGGTHTDPYSGMFTVSWNPPKEGLWWIIASFPGSKSYWPSFAETSIAVTAAPAAPPAAPTTTDITIIAAIAIAIIIGIANLAIILKKK
jgi:hypothetical protein